HHHRPAPGRSENPAKARLPLRGPASLLRPPHPLRAHLFHHQGPRHHQHRPRLVPPHRPDPPALWLARPPHTHRPPPRPPPPPPPKPHTPPPHPPPPPPPPAITGPASTATRPASQTPSGKQPREIPIPPASQKPSPARHRNTRSTNVR